MLTDLLKPLETFIHANYAGTWLHDAAFHLFRWLHLYFYEYIDYLFFMVLALPVFYILPRRARPCFMLASSFALISVLYGLVFTCTLTLLPFLFYLSAMQRREKALSDKAYRKRSSAILVTAILFIYGLLLARESFEWAPFIPLLNTRFSVPLLHIAGVAFMVPKLIHFVIDTLNGKINNPSKLNFLLFILFFPIFRLGPIESYNKFESDLTRSTEKGVEKFDIPYGIFRILLGLLKTFLYAAIFYPIRKFYPEDLNTVSLLSMYGMFFVIILEVYCHFSGYSDIAIGLSRLMGFRMTENFYLPFFSPNIGEWWRRWHISLSLWLRHYVYLPLGGGRIHAYRNYIITFVICGAWHYISWHYIIWGFLQGIGLCILRLWKIFWYLTDNRPGFCDFLKPLVRFMKTHPRLSYTSAVIFTIHYFCISGIFFIYEAEFAARTIRKMLSFGLLPF